MVWWHKHTRETVNCCPLHGRVRKASQLPLKGIMYDILLYCMFAVYTMITNQFTYMYRKPIYTDDYIDFGRCHHLIRHKYPVVNALFWNKADKSHLIMVGWRKEHKQAFNVLARNNNYYPSSLMLYKYETLHASNF